MATFTWLHLTDLHCGQKGQSWRWPTVREIVLTDLQKLYDKTGAWDLVLFTGDLAFSGQQEEYDTVNTVFNELWEQFDKLGFTPPLLTVPGNHDLVWPADPMHPTVRPFLKWNADEEFQDYFWSTAASDYHAKINEVFTNYLNWRDTHSAIPKSIITGLLPGDVSFTLQKGDARLGILGLNTAFLQLTGDDYAGKLALHTQQFHAACGGDGPAWAKQHHACLLLTHHPPEWLNTQSRTHFDGEIFSHNYFIAHLCGHLHETRSLVTSEAGTEPRRRWQGKSLFGLEEYAGQQQRLHGYVVGRLTLQGGTTSELTFWPREARKQGSQRNIVPDQSVVLTDDQHTNPLACHLLTPYKPEQQVEAQADEQGAAAPPAGTANVPNDLHREIAALLLSLPTMHDTASQRSFVLSAGLDAQLQQQIHYNLPVGQFVELLVEILSKYGTLADGRHPLEAILQAAKGYGGKEIQDTSEALIQRIQDLSGFRQPELLEPDRSRTPDRSDSDAAPLREAYLTRLFKQVSRLDLAGINRNAVGPDAKYLNLGAVYTALLTHSAEHNAGSPDRAMVLRAQKDQDRDSDRRLSALDQLNEHDRLVLLGDPGSGKSTFVKFVAMCMAGELLGEPWADLQLLTAPLPNDEGKDEEQPQHWQHDPLLPVLVVLRNFAAKGLPPDGEQATADHLWKFIVQDLEKAALGQYASHLYQHLQQHGALVLLDGLDEVPEADRRRTQIKQAVEDFADSFSKCRIVVTSRTYAYQQQDWQLSEFTETVLAAFSQGQIRRFIDSWYDHIAEMRGMDAEDARGRAELLKRAIFGSERLAEFAQRPLLLTLMASLHAWRGGSLPEKRGDLYKEATELLLDWWENAKVVRDEKGQVKILQPSLSEMLQIGKERVQQILNKLAFEAHAGQQDLVGTADIPEESLLEELWNLKGSRDVKQGRVIEFLSERAGLLVTHGNKIYTFPHRTFQEYLAACYLTREQDYPCNVAKLARSDPDRWREVVFLAAASVANAAPMIWALVGELCYRKVDDSGNTTEDAWGALFAGQALLETANLDDISPGNRPKVELVQDWLAAILTEQAPAGESFPAVERALAGNILGVLGDTRLGVGLREDGLPDIAWHEVPKGPFLMGSSSEEIEQVKDLYKGIEFALEWEQPQHEVHVPAFQISRYPVTNAQFRAFIRDNGYADEQYWTPEGWTWREENSITEPDWAGGSFDLENHPVVRVSWYEAVAFCNWLTIRLRDVETRRSASLPGHDDEFIQMRRSASLQVRLPTEAEWEKTARSDDARVYPWGTDQITPELANYGDTGLGTTSAVGCFPRGASAYGCEEMVGNVWEWCLDSWHGNYDGAPTDGSAWMGGENFHPVRGGSWIDDPHSCRCAYRPGNDPGGILHDRGFRVVVVPRTLR